MKTAGEIIKEARLNAGLNQIELGKKSGVYSNTIGKIERNEQKPSYKTLKKLAKVLDIDINKFPE
jgi:transcriptional regulator with XRE-family HTH domain